MKRRVLILHNAYRDYGGEDAVVASEVALLRSRGHEVQVLERHNDETVSMPRASLAVNTLWSRKAHEAVRRTVAAFQPDVVHVHNTLPLLSPSVYWAAGAQRVPVVQTLHNFRLLCPQATFLRDGKICEDCLGKSPWRGVVRGCYRDSVAQSAVLATMLQMHRSLGTWQRRVDRYIALNEFCRQKFVQGGLPADRVAVKPNFVDSPQVVQRPRNGLLFVGRLSEEKGVAVLAQAMHLLPGMGLRVAGTGPAGTHLNGMAGIELLGRLTPQQVLREMATATALVVPSICHETFGLVVVEAFATGTPVIASRTGALADLVEDGRNGLLFTPADAADLASKLRWAANHPEPMAAMGRAGRRDYERLYTPDANYSRLMAIYEDATHVARHARQK
jgi:glycosyltransferase involved in cell wall biosynthesis